MVLQPTSRQNIEPVETSGPAARNQVRVLPVDPKGTVESLVDQFLERGTGDDEPLPSTSGAPPSSFANVKCLISQEQSKLNLTSKLQQQRCAATERQRTTFTDVVSARNVEGNGRDCTNLAASLVQPGGAALKRRNSEALPGQQQPASKRANVAGDSAASLAAAQRDFVLQGTSPPVDWSLKTCARFMSPSRLDALEQAAGATPGRAACEGLRGFAQSCDWLTDQEKLQQALCSWQYPDAQLPAAAVSLLAATSAGASILAERQAAFREALRSLNLALQHGCCDAFYVLPPSEGARRRLAVLFRAQGVAGRCQVHALVSHSTTGLRQLLRGGDYQLRYEMPLARQLDRQEQQQQGGGGRSAGGRQQTGGDRGGDDGWRQQQQDGVGGSQGVDEKLQQQVDGSPQSLLLIWGAPSVMALYDLLYNEAAGAFHSAKGDGGGGSLLGGGACDVPLLLAPTPFPGAVLTRLRPKLLAPSTTAGDGLVLYRAELGGSSSSSGGRGALLLPPWTVERLHSCLSNTQRGHLRCSYETHRLTTGFNLPLVPPRGEEAQEGGEMEPGTTIDGDGGPDDSICVGGGNVVSSAMYSSGCLSQEEYDRRRRPCCSLRGGYIRQVDVRGGDVESLVTFRVPQQQQ